MASFLNWLDMWFDIVGLWTNGEIFWTWVIGVVVGLIMMAVLTMVTDREGR